MAKEKDKTIKPVKKIFNIRFEYEGLGGFVRMYVEVNEYKRSIIANENPQYLLYECSEKDIPEALRTIENGLNKENNES